MRIDKQLLVQILLATGVLLILIPGIPSLVGFVYFGVDISTFTQYSVILGIVLITVGIIKGG
jgi:hypothetical protein